MHKDKLIEKYPIPWSARKIASFRETLLSWYDAHGRDLPWRKSQNPYHIWVSEIMLQQTQVATVIPYFERFIREIPTISDLAALPEEELLTYWQGLGYYSRVRNMQAAAQQMVEQHGAALPETMPELLALKGIGPYTAAAVGSIAFNLPEPALDGNLIRIVSRLFEITEDVNLTASRQKMLAYLYQMIDLDRAGDFNQALMDIGATIMTASNPYPEDNPIQAFDQSFHKQTSHLYPLKLRKTKVSQHNWTAYYIVNEKGECLMRKHSESELLTALWHFPLVENQMIYEEASQQELWEPFIHEYSLNVVSKPFLISGNYRQKKETYQVSQPFPKVKHIFSHRKWEVTLLAFYLASNGINLEGSDLEWKSPDEQAEIPISTLQNKLFKEIAAIHLEEY